MSNWNDISEMDFERINAAGVYFCKIADAKIEITKNGSHVLRIRFATKNGKFHDEGFFISAKALFKIKKLLTQMELTKEELSSINFDMNNPEKDSDTILQYMKKHLVGKLVKLALEIDTYKTNEKYTNYQFSKIRPLTSKEINENHGIQNIEMKFPKEEQMPLPNYQSGDDVPF